MSGTIEALSGLSLLGGEAAQIFFGPKRKIGPYLPTLTIEEDAEDAMEITDHPVEYGAEISDHAFKRPSMLRMRVAWSDSGVNAVISAATSLFTSGTNPLTTPPSKKAYTDLLDLQSKRTLITVVTGKRSYKNCLIERIHNFTDVETENALFLELEIRQLIIVKTKTTSTQPQENMSTPASTAPVIPAGNQSLATPSNQSMLYSYFSKLL